MLAPCNRAEGTEIEPDVLDEHGQVARIAQWLHDLTRQRHNGVCGVQKTENGRQRLHIDDARWCRQVPLLEYRGQPLSQETAWGRQNPQLGQQVLQAELGFDRQWVRHSRDRRVHLPGERLAGNGACRCSIG